MRKQVIVENTGTDDRSARDIFVGCRRGYYGKLIESRLLHVFDPLEVQDSGAVLLCIEIEM